MRNSLEVILLAVMPDDLRKDAESPVAISLNKEQGLMGKVSVTSAGPLPGVLAGLEVLLSDVLKEGIPGDVERQRGALEMIYQGAKVRLNIK